MSTVHTSAASLYRAILSDAADSGDDDYGHAMPEWRQADEGEMADYTDFECHDVRKVESLQERARGKVAMHGCEHPGRRPDVRVTYTSRMPDGVRSSMTVRRTRARLLALADTVRIKWALFGGGPVPADLAKPKAAKRAVTWPASIVKVWLQQFEDKDYAGAMLTGERLDAVFYPGAKGCAFILAAPIQVEGLPEGVCSARRNDGKWVVACMQSGRAIESRGYGSRKTAEESALSEVARVGLDKLTAALERNRADAVDHDEARAAWCKACNIEDPREPAPVAQPAPESEEGAESADDWAARMVAMVAQPVDVAPVATAPDALERSPDPAPVSVAPDAAQVAPVAHAAPPVVQAAGPVVAPSAVYVLPLGGHALHEEWRACESRKFTPNPRQILVMAAVRVAIAEGAYYTKDVLAACVKSLCVSDADQADGALRVEGGTFGMDCYYARKALDAIKHHAAEDAAAAAMALKPGQKLPALMFNDFKLIRAVSVESVTDGGMSATFIGSRGSSKVSGTCSALQLQYAIERAAERAARRAEGKPTRAATAAPQPAPAPAAPPAAATAPSAPPVGVSAPPVMETPVHPLAASAAKLESLRAELADEARTGARSDGFLLHCIELHQAAHDKLAAAFRVFDFVGLGAELANTDGRRFCVLLPDASAPGSYRWQGFDARGFFTHSTHPNAWLAVADAADQGYTVAAPGILDRLASTPEWAHGMAVSEVIQARNSGLLPWREAHDRLATLYAKHAALASRAPEVAPEGPGPAAAPGVAESAPPVTVSAGPDAATMRKAADRAQVLADGIKAAAGDDPATMARMLKSEAARVKAAALGMPARIAASYRATADMLEYAAELHADAMARAPIPARQAQPCPMVQTMARRPGMARCGPVARHWSTGPGMARRPGGQARHGPAAPRMLPPAAAPPVMASAPPVAKFFGIN